MDERNSRNCTAFEGTVCIASGDLRDVAKKVKEVIGSDAQAPILIFDDLTSEPIELDFRGSVQDVLKRLEKSTMGDESAATPSPTVPSTRRGPGRPKLGVVSREVTLLPRHWEWLNSQPGGASVALRKLVEGARKLNNGRDRVRHSQEAAFRFMSAMAGNLPDFEEAARALFAGDSGRFSDRIASWPVDIRKHAQKLAKGAMEKQN